MSQPASGRLAAPMILVTSAGGKTGAAVVRALSARNAPIRGFVRQTTVPRADLAGADELVTGDLLDLEAMRRAMSGAHAVYLIAPNVHPEEARIGEIAIAAARETGVHHLVYHSVLHPQTREMPHHWRKLAVEERLFSSGLSYTILQPGAYMQNVLAFLKEIRNDGVYRVPYGDGGALSLVDLEDVAEVAARVLLRPGHDGATYELAGPDVLTPSAIARILSESLSRAIVTEAEPIDAWSERARSSGLTEEAIDALSRMFDYYDRHGLRGSPRVLECLLGRQPVTFAEFVAREFGTRV